MEKSSTNVRELDYQDKRMIQEFLDLPYRIYSGSSVWVPPLLDDIRRMMNRSRHPFYRYGDAAFYIALEDGKAVGRLAVLDNRNYNNFNRESTAFFYLFECENDYQTACKLFEAAFEWARRRGLEKIQGPRGFSVFDGLGMLVRGFEHRPAFGLPYNPPYYPELVEKCGFHSKGNILSGYLDQNLQFPERLIRAADLIKERRGLKVRPFKSRTEIMRLIPYLKDLYNSAFSAGEDNIPLTDEDVKLLAKQMLWFADPKLIKIVEKDHKPVGFLLAYPDVSAGLQKARGKLFPLGWIYIVQDLFRTKWININGAGMLPGYRGLGGTTLLFSEMYKSVKQSRYRYADLVQIGAENDKMLREMRHFGVNFYKTHRIYERML